MRQVTKRKRPCRWINFGEMVFLLGCRSSLKMTVTNFLKKWTLWVSTKIFANKVRCLIYPDLQPHCCRQIRGGTHPGHHLLYEFHSNQTGSPDKVGSFCVLEMSWKYRLLCWFYEFTVSLRHLLGVKRAKVTFIFLDWLEQNALYVIL